MTTICRSGDLTVPPLVGCCLWNPVLCVLIVEGMSVVVNVMLSLMSVMSPLPALCNLSVRTSVKLCILGVLALGVSFWFPEL